MTELFYLLDRAAGQPMLATSDVDSDVARGIRALRRRRVGAAGGFLAVGVAAAAVPALIGQGTARGLGQMPAGGSTTATATSTPTWPSTDSTFDFSISTFGSGPARVPAPLSCVGNAAPLSVTLSRGTATFMFTCVDPTSHLADALHTSVATSGPSTLLATQDSSGPG
jgi:hypothetical protein